MLFAHGNDYKAALRDFVSVSGPIAMMDAEAYGVWYSHYYLPGTSAAQSKDLIARYQQLQLPLNALVLDVGWHIEEDSALRPDCLKYGGYTWNRTLFPDPAAFTSDLHAAKLKLLVNTHPYTGVDSCQRFYEPMARRLGIDPTSREVLHCAWTDKRWSEAIHEFALDPIMNGSISSIDWIWTDYDRRGSGYMGIGGDPYWFQCPYDARGDSPMLWSSAVHVNRQVAQGKRGMGMWPYGGLGSHRFPLVGSGDTQSAWSTLAYQVYMTATSANVATHWTHDLGGFHPDENRSAIGPPSGPPHMCSWPELWTRWLQWGVFSPVFRTHCGHSCRCEPWFYMVDATYTQAITEALQLRNALVPYIYSAAYEATQTGITISHPLYYDWPEHHMAYEMREQYLFGPSMMVAALVQAADPATNLTTRALWIPPGQWWPWLHAADRKPPTALVGPMYVQERSFGLLEIPVFVRSGAIIPMKTLESSHKLPPNPLVLKAFPGTSGSARVYEDEGSGLGYRKGAFYMTHVAQMRTANSVQMSVSPQAEGNGYPGAPTSRRTEVHLLSPREPRVSDVTCNGIHLIRTDNRTVPGFWTESQGIYAVLVVACAEGLGSAPLQIDIVGYVP